MSDGDAYVTLGAIEASPTDGPEATRRHATTERSSRRTMVLVALTAVVIASIGLHLWGIYRDLPYGPDVDEPVFVGAAVQMLQHHSLDPAWYDHPGSTVIYPIAALSAAWYWASSDLPPFAHPVLGIDRELQVNPGVFYLIGRLVSIVYGVACVIATWLLARRFLGDVGGILAAVVVAVTPLVVAYGQLVRTDVAAMFYALITLWLLMRAMELGRVRDWVFVGVAFGLAVSTRYFYVTLVIPYVIAAFLAWDASRAVRAAPVEGRRTLFAPLVGLLAIPITFAATSPFVVIHRSAAVAALVGENGATHPGADGLSPLGNLAWYLLNIVPSALGPTILALGFVGVYALSRREPRPSIVLLSFALSYVAGVSASPFHWDRYAIPLIPVIAIFAVGGALGVGDAVRALIVRRQQFLRAGPSARSTTARHGSLVALATATLIVALAVAPSFSTVVARDRLATSPSMRVVSTNWVRANLLSSGRIAQEAYTTYLPDSDTVMNTFTLAKWPLSWYRTHGYRYLITTPDISDRFLDAGRYPKESAFYRELAGANRLVRSFSPSADQRGSNIAIYDLGS